MYILIKKWLAVYILLMFSLTVIIGVLCQINLFTAIVRGTVILCSYGIVGLLLSFFIFA